MPPAGFEPATYGLGNRCEHHATSEPSGTCERPADSCPENCPELARIADALADLPEAQRQAMAAHIEALLALPEAKRQAIFLLATK